MASIQNSLRNKHKSYYLYYNFFFIKKKHWVDAVDYCGNIMSFNFLLNNLLILYQIFVKLGILSNTPTYDFEYQR